MKLLCHVGTATVSLAFS